MVSKFVFSISVSETADILKATAEVLYTDHISITAVFVTHDQDEAMVMSDVIHLMYQGHIEQSGRPTELYTKPATKFAASFIGHYNLLDAATMKKICGEDLGSESIAFRPELIRVSTEPVEDPESYVIPGKVSLRLPHGNVLRYAIMCGDTQVDVDALFGTEMLYNTGDQVWLSIRRDECVYL